MGNNTSSLQPEPRLNISGPTHLVTTSSLARKLQEQDQDQDQDNEKQKPTEKFTNIRSMSQPLLSISETYDEQKFSRNSLPDSKLLPIIPRISFNFEGYDMTLFKQIEAHATAAPAIDNIQTAFLCSDVDYDMRPRVEPYDDLVTTAEGESLQDRRVPTTPTITAIATTIAATMTTTTTTTTMTTTTTRQPTYPSSPQSLRHKNSSSSLLSFKSLKSKASLSSLRSKVSDATFELVTPPGSMDGCNGERPSIVVTKKTRVLYDGRKGEWQFDDTEAKASEPEPEQRGRYMRRILRSSR